MTEKRRAFEHTLEIDASRDDVWRALTEAEELMRWFPLRAEVTPGVGGSMLWAWDESGDWKTRIDAWEPGRLLRLVQDDYRPADGAEPARVVMEFTLETHAGKTRLRLVHSGFGRGEAWDNELDGISEGWPAELASLRRYLECHKGTEGRRDPALDLTWAAVIRYQPVTAEVLRCATRWGRSVSTWRSRTRLARASAGGSRPCLWTPARNCPGSRRDSWNRWAWSATTSGASARPTGPSWSAGPARSRSPSPGGEREMRSSSGNRTTSCCSAPARWRGSTFGSNPSGSAWWTRAPRRPRSGSALHATPP